MVGFFSRLKSHLCVECKFKFWEFELFTICISAGSIALFVILKAVL